jgi:hypothetical protein
MKSKPMSVASECAKLFYDMLSIPMHSLKMVNEDLLIYRRQSFIQKGQLSQREMISIAQSYTIFYASNAKLIRANAEEHEIHW